FIHQQQKQIKRYYSIEAKRFSISTGLSSIMGVGSICLARLMQFLLRLDGRPFILRGEHQFSCHGILEERLAVLGLLSADVSHHLHRSEFGLFVFDREGNLVRRPTSGDSLQLHQWFAVTDPLFCDFEST
ncbi:hypothetical protein PMAYCL1PPCAC_18399, partial [Pristionchus mayeri]